MKQVTLASLLVATLLATSSCVAVTRSEPYPREVIALKFASADDLAGKLRFIYGETDLQVVPDQRTNSLILIASAKRMPEIKQVIAKLDVEVK